MPDSAPSPQTAAALVAHALPGGAVRGVALRSSGPTAMVFAVERSAAPSPVVVKIYDEQHDWKRGKEAHVYGLLSRIPDLPVPEVLRTSPGYGPGRPPSTILSGLGGVPLSAVVDGMSGVERRQIYRQIGSVLAAIHTIGQPGFGYLITTVVNPASANAVYMDRQFTAKLDEFSQHDGPPALRRRIRRRVAERHALFDDCRTAVLCHDDLHEGNVLVARTEDGWRVTGIIDVENAVAADPLLDVAKTTSYSVRGDPDKLAGLLDGYGDMPVNWAERVEIYELYHALELWCWFASLGRADALDGLEQAMVRLSGG